MEQKNNVKMVTIKLTGSELMRIGKLVEGRLEWMIENKERVGIEDHTLAGWQRMWATLDRAREAHWESTKKK